MSYSMNHAAAKRYRSVGIISEVEAATPHRLIQLLMERFLTRVSIASRHMQAGEVAPKGEAISQAISIVDCLRASLNHEPAPELSSNFDALYDYMSRRLLESNLNNDAAGLDEVGSLMREIKVAWDTIGEELSKKDGAGAAGSAG